MSIETTLNLQTDALEKLCEASEKTGKTKSKLVILLMEKVVSLQKELFSSFMRIGYQQRDPERKWARPHIWLREDAYEYALDLRKLFKMSFSAIIALAIEKFLDDVVQDLLYPEKAKKGDNYCVKNYILVQDFHEEIISWRIYWGIPRDPAAVYPIRPE